MVLNSIIGLSGEHRFGLIVRSKDHLVPCAGLEWPKVSVQGKNVRIGQVYSIFSLLHFPGFQKSAGHLFPESEMITLIVQVGIFSEFANSVYLLKTISFLGI